MEFRPFYLARAWQRLGCETTIVAASFSHLRSRSPHADVGLVEEQVDGVRYIWLKTPRYEGNGLGRVLNMFAFTRGLHRHQAFLAQKCRPDVLITTSTYPLANVPAYRLAKKARAKCVYEVRDLWPLTLIELEGMSKWHPFILLMQWAENFSYRKADRVSCTLPNAASYMVEHGMEARKFAYIPNGIAVGEWKSADKPLAEEHARTLSALKAEGAFLLGYAGSHGISNALGSFLEAANLLQQKRVAFVFVGQGPEKERLQHCAWDEKLDNAIFLPPISRESLPAFLGLMDACFLGWQRKPIYRFGVSPNKLLDYMMAGKPVVHATGAGNDPVVDSQCGFSVPAESPGAIAEAVNRLANMSAAEREAIGQRGRRYVEAHHDYNVIARRYLEILQ